MMDSLTVTNCVGRVVMKSPVVCERCGEIHWSPMTESGENVAEYIASYEEAAPLKKVQEWAKAEREGRLVVLPCKIGDMVYYLDGFYCGLCRTHHRWIRERHFCIEDVVGKTVFLTREGAQAAIEAQKGDHTK